jgi:hypothetical protein
VTALRNGESGGGGPARSPGAAGGAKGAVVVGLAVILGIVGLQILDDSDDGSSSATGTTTGVTVTTGPGVTTVPMRTNANVRVKVYNATGVSGKAQALTDTLKADGYNTQEPTSLEDRPQGIVVECVAGFEREAGVLSLYGVGPPSTVADYPSDPPEGASDADCLVIIGSV